MFDLILTVTNLVVAFVYMYVVFHYLPNIPTSQRKFFWWINVAMAIMRQFLLVFVKDAEVRLVSNTLLSAFISAYFIYYIMKNYGKKEQIRRKIEQQQLNMINTILPYNISPYSENTIGVKGYKFDINTLINEATSEWAELGGSGIFFRNYGGERKFECVAAIELETRQDVNFPFQYHKYNEVVDVLKGYIGIKDGVVATVDNPVMILEDDTHYLVAKKGTHSVHYFIEP